MHVSKFYGIINGPMSDLFSIAFDYNAKPDKFYFEAEVRGWNPRGKVVLLLIIIIRLLDHWHQKKW
jgi:hypothetical protein